MEITLNNNVDDFFKLRSEASLVLPRVQPGTALQVYIIYLNLNA